MVVDFLLPTSRQSSHHLVFNHCLCNRSNLVCFLFFFSILLECLIFKMQIITNIRICTLYFQNPTRARDEILGLFSNHVNAIKTIYGDTNFTTYDGSLGYIGVSFVVQRTTVSNSSLHLQSIWKVFLLNVRWIFLILINSICFINSDTFWNLI